jgi:hypothetical protein
VYTSAGIPGTGIYAIHHYRSTPGEHPRVAGNAGGGCLLLVLLVATLVVIAAIGR